MRSTRWRAQAALGAFVAVLLIAAGVTIVWLATATPVRVHESAAAVPSTPAAAPAGGYLDPAEQSRRLAREVTAGDNLPGLSVAVAVDGAVVWAEGFGWADVESHRPITPDTRFRLGALSKPLTAVAAGLLRDRGRLDLDAPIQRYVPAYPAKQWTVTTRQLLGDVGGVHRIRGDNNDAMPTAHCASVADGVALLAGDPLLFEPGTQHRYSIWGWVLASAVVEGAAQEPFARFMDRELFEPLAMTRTVTSEPAGASGATPFSSPRRVFGVQVGSKEEAKPDYSCLAGGGAFLSTPTDLVRLGSAILGPGLLTAETIAALQTPTRLTSGTPTTYALGWTVGTVQLAGRAARMVSHRGSPRGGSVSLLTFPGLGIAIAAASNVTDARGVNAYALQVADAFAKQRGEPSRASARPHTTVSGSSDRRLADRRQR